MTEYAVMPLADYVGCCEKIREKANTTEDIKSGEMPQKINEVYEVGKKAEYDEFWDSYQASGNRTDYGNAFAGIGWKEEVFNPKYDMTPSNSYMMFRGNPMSVDLVEYLNNRNVKLDFSKSINTQYLFNNSAFTRIGVIDANASTNSIPLDGAFTGCANLVTIDKIVLKTGSIAEVNAATFNNCTALENVTFDGAFAKNGLNLRWSTKLSKASITSVINCLSTTTSGLSVTLSKNAVNKAFETIEGANDGTTSAEWTSLIGTRSNWTISLI